MVKFNNNSRGNKLMYKQRSVRMHLGFFLEKIRDFIETKSSKIDNTE